MSHQDKYRHSDRLKALIQSGGAEDLKEAWYLLRDVAIDHDELAAEQCVVVVLREEKSSPALLDNALQAFIDSERLENNASWIHALSHFSKHLWERGLHDWIRRFNSIAFSGTNTGYAEHTCADRLVKDFAQYAAWNQDPADFEITEKNIGKWMHECHAKRRAFAGRFQTEEAFLIFQIRNLDRSSSDWRTEREAIETARGMIARLVEFGVDVSEFQTFERDALMAMQSYLEQKLNSFEGLERERAMSGWIMQDLSEIRGMLAEL